MDILISIKLWHGYPWLKLVLQDVVLTVPLYQYVVGESSNGPFDQCWVVRPQLFFSCHLRPRGARLQRRANYTYCPALPGTIVRNCSTGIRPSRSPSRIHLGPRNSQTTRLRWTVGIVWKYSFNIPMNAFREAQHSEDLGILDEGRLPYAYDNFDFNSNEGSSDAWVRRPLTPELPNVSNLTRFLAREMLMAAMMFRRWCGQPKLK